MISHIPSVTGDASRPVILVPGSEGLNGSRIIRALTDRLEVVGVDVKESPDRDSKSSIIQCDLTQDGSVTAALRDVVDRFGPRLASVIHLAAYYDFTGEPSPLYDELTVEGTRRLLRR